MRIPWGYKLGVARKYGAKIPIEIPLQTHCHAIIVGSSGCGKSTALQFLVGKALRANPDLNLVFCDFKKSESFDYMENYPSYYAADSCYDGVMSYYQRFTEARQKGQAESKTNLLVFDEYPGFISYLQGQDRINKTKRTNDVLGAVSEILMLGRRIGNSQFGLWLVCQRPSAELFSGGARDNAMIILALARGRFSKELKSMVLPNQDIPDRVYQVGEGVLLADGYELQEVKFPRIVDMDNWNRNILKILSKSK